MKYKTILLIMLLCATFAAAQSPENGNKKVDENMKADYSEDHRSIDSIIKATYAVISGGKGVQRDWDRFRALFYEDARLIPTGTNKEGFFVASSNTPDEYISRSSSFLINNGFFEQEISRKTDIFGNIAQVFSTYEGRNALSDEKPFLRGINSFQLLNDGNRWWVLTIYWQAESKDFPLPEMYLPAK